MPTFEQSLTAGRVTTDEALDLFDGLDVVPLEFLFGVWRGSEFPTGHPMDGMLTATGWYGKQFVDAETAVPLRSGAAGRQRDSAKVPAAGGPRLRRRCAASAGR